MTVLVVEDDENKRNQLRQFLRETFPEMGVDLERSLQGGVRRIRRSRPDLVLLDMTLPNYDPGPDEPGGQTHIFGGQEFLRQMDRFEIVLPVIVVTQFETFGKPPNTKLLQDLDRELRAEHATSYRGAVYYHSAIHGWKEELKELMRLTLADGRRGDLGA
jgi:CheY-like chemotaxis protein